MLVGEYTSLAFMLPASAFVGYGLGYLLDKEFETNWLYIVGLILGIVAGLVQLIRQLMRDTPAMSNRLKPAFSDELWMRSQPSPRIWKLMWAIAAGGAIMFLVWRGWRGPSASLGTAVSCLNFRWLSNSPTPSAERPRSPVKPCSWACATCFWAACAYVILRFSAISLPAALSGLFVSVAAVIVEIMFELAYARN